MTNKKLFGTSGIRGKIGSEINSELALKIGKSLAKYLNNTGKVVIGYDTRTTNRMLEQAITAGLIEHGVDVVKIGMVPTPLVGYATLKLDGDAGIMLTASHNPSQYNGIKLWNKNGMAYTPEQEERIEEILNECDDAFFEYEDDLPDNNILNIVKKDNEYILDFYSESGERFDLAFSKLEDFKNLIVSMRLISITTNNIKDTNENS